MLHIYVQFIECEDMVQFKECSASSEATNWECKNVYGKDTGWESLNNDASPWIKLNLKDEYELQQLKIQTTGGIKKFAQILIEFSSLGTKYIFHKYRWPSA